MSDDIVLKAIRSAERICCHLQQEFILFQALMNEIITLPITTTCHIPRSVRPLFAEVLAKELRHAKYDGVWGFARLFLLPKAVLRCPSRGGKKKRHVVKAELLSRLQKGQTGNLVGLWEDARIDAKRHNQKSKHFTVTEANAKRALRLAREGRYSSAMKALGLLSCAPLDDTSALDELRQRHLEHLLPEWNEDIPSH